MNNNLAILVISCDKYFDVIDPFFDLFYKFWNDCPYKIYLGTNNYSYNHKQINIQNINIGDDLSWCDNLRKMIDIIDESYILLFLDDYFLCRPVETSIIENMIKISISKDVSCFKFTPTVKSKIKYVSIKDVFVIDSSHDYCINAAISIWNKNVLKKLLKPGYSAWDFEVLNSKKCKSEGKLPGLFLQTKKTYFFIKNGVIKGKWFRESVYFCKKHGIFIDTRKREIMSLKETVYEYIKIYLYRFLPKSIHKVCKKALIKIGFRKLFVNPYT